MEIPCIPTPLSTGVDAFNIQIVVSGGFLFTLPVIDNQDAHSKIQSIVALGLLGPKVSGVQPYYPPSRIDSISILNTSEMIGAGKITEVPNEQVI